MPSHGGIFGCHSRPKSKPRCDRGGCGRDAISGVVRVCRAESVVRDPPRGRRRYAFGWLCPTRSGQADGREVGEREGGIAGESARGRLETLHDASNPGALPLSCLCEVVPLV